MKKIIEETIEDLVGSFLEYDRNMDEDLRPGDIETAILNGDISIDQIVEKFKKELVINIW